ncbi:hypothetical protein [Desulfonema magnum]|uniref:Uncharacterized protein n=1 Tax=Desulfonema magnum TaxID=45655 RepID=A0A975BHI9_9BACT|nr:hypothetical protein [Desulfonema magnum]QTA85561.1 Uncharacterized protein dnm_015720 [Desulfonema magnum]QTA85562.1 Uncharacterized protein dnm_015730 [Desulfonema magnum]
MAAKIPPSGSIFALPSTPLQFNRKAEINAKIRYLKKEIEEFNH